MSAETLTPPTDPSVQEVAPISQKSVLSKFAGRILASPEVLEEDLEAYKRAGSSTLALREPTPVEMVPAADLDTLDEKQEAVDEVLDENHETDEDQIDEEVEGDKPAEYPPLKLVKESGNDHDDSTSTANFNDIADLIEFDEYGMGHRGIKKTSEQKGDGKFVSRYEMEQIQEHQDLIRTGKEPAPENNGPEQKPNPSEDKIPEERTEAPTSKPASEPETTSDADAEVAIDDEVQDEDGQLRPMTEDEIYVRAFQKKHTTTKVGVGHKEPPSRGPSIQEMVGQDSRTELQKQAELRANTRLNAINRREYELKEYTDLYGEEILDKKALKEVISQSRLSSGEKHALKKAGRKARRAKASIDRLTNRLEKSAEGRDISGRLVRARLAMARRKKA